MLGLRVAAFRLVKDHDHTRYVQRAPPPGVDRTSASCPFLRPTRALRRRQGGALGSRCRRASRLERGWLAIQRAQQPYLGRLRRGVVSLHDATSLSRACSFCQSHYTVLFSADGSVNPQDTDKATEREQSTRRLGAARHWTSSTLTSWVASRSASA